MARRRKRTPISRRILRALAWSIRRLAWPTAKFLFTTATSYLARPEGRVSVVVLINAALILTALRASYALAVVPTVLILLSHALKINGLDVILVFPFGTLATNLSRHWRRAAAKPFTREISAFVKAHAQGGGGLPLPLPRPLNVEPDQLATFHAYLKSRGFRRSAKTLREILEHEACHLSVAEVERRLLHAKPGLTANSSRQEFCAAYLAAFQADTRYVPNLAVLLGVKAVTLSRILDRQIQIRREQRNQNHLAQILAGGETLATATITQIDNLTGHDFETFLETFFKDMGYQVTPTRQTSDQGADLILERFGRRIVVQAKCYSQNIGNGAVQEVVAAKDHYNCEHAMVVANQPFTKSARDLARSNRVELWDRARLTRELENFPQRMIR